MVLIQEILLESYGLKVGDSIKRESGALFWSANRAGVGQQQGHSLLQIAVESQPAEIEICDGATQKPSAKFAG